MTTQPTTTEPTVTSEDENDAADMNAIYCRPEISRHTLMMRKVTGMRRLVSSLYHLARLANDLTTLASGRPKRIVRRATNKLLGRKLISKVWKWPF